MIAIVGAITIVAGGSLLGIFLDDIWAGAFVVTLVMGFALGEGMFQLWEQTVGTSEVLGSEVPPLADLLHALWEDGADRREKVQSDPDWGTVHTHSGLQAWRESVDVVLREEVPGLALWFHPMESPGAGLRQSSERSLKAGHLSEFDWSLDRLADIEAMSRANSPGGHPGGEEKTRRLLTLERSLRVLQEIRLLSQQLPGGIPGIPGMMDPKLVNERMVDCTERAEKVLSELAGAAGAGKLLNQASVDPAMLRAGIDAGRAHEMAIHHVALRQAMGQTNLWAQLEPRHCTDRPRPRPDT